MKVFRMSELFTVAQIRAAQKIVADGVDVNTKLVAEVVLPILPDINEKTGQQNDARYLAYVLEYAITQSGG